MTTSFIHPYLFFNGRCDEALAFYKEAIGAQLDMVMRYKESPQPPPPGMIPPDWDDKIMHCSFRVGQTLLMASDGCGPNPNFSGFSLSIALGSEAEAEKVFAALSAGGEVEARAGYD